MPKKGETELAGVYWSEYGPIKVDLIRWVWCGTHWVMPGSEIATQIAEELKTKDQAK